MFLDEIGELPLPLQPKLLRVLQERTFERVGGNAIIYAIIHADVRIVAATKSLDDEVDEKTFRGDVLQRYSFPGNVRELEHLMERASVPSGGRAITGGRSPGAT